MTEPWKHQIRIDLDPGLAEVARQHSDAPALKSLIETLAGHGATMKCQFNAFSDYVAEAERRGSESYPLYAWTKATIEDPAKRAKYLQSFTLYVGADEVYDKAVADALETDLAPFVESGLIRRLSRYDTNPANNPQPPRPR